MIKKIIFISLSVLLLAYILFAVFFLNPKAGNGVCKNVEIVIVDTLDRHFIDAKDIAIILKGADINPVGEKMKNINIENIEKTVLQNKLIKKAECYKTTGTTIKIEIHQKIPILRVISISGENYYLDMDGGIMPASGKFAVYVPIVTGYAEKAYVKTKLYNFALFLKNNEFWNAQIEQINITAKKEIELTPRIGDHQIILGEPDEFEEKLEKLKLFYDKGLDEMGWNRYSSINLKYKNQIVCTKKTVLISTTNEAN